MCAALRRVACGGEGKRSGAECVGGGGRSYVGGEGPKKGEHSVENSDEKDKCERIGWEERRRAGG